MRLGGLGKYLLVTGGLLAAIGFIQSASFTDDVERLAWMIGGFLGVVVAIVGLGLAFYVERD
jgi:hypothetical protein